jgi:7-cyano-7-deazaguanine synthase
VTESIVPSLRKAVVLLSGGIDSAACAHLLLSQGRQVTGIFIDHGQSAAHCESSAASYMASHLQIPLRRISVDSGELFGPGELVGRNAFLALTALFFSRSQSTLIAMGLHGGTPYYDCSGQFIDSLSRLIAEHTNGQTTFVAPFATWTKKDVFEYFKSAKLPIELTYSCEAGAAAPCGTCASCRDRQSISC